MDENKIISIEDFKGSNIEKAFVSVSKTFSITAIKNAAMATLTSNLERGAIDKDTFNKAVEQLSALIEKRDRVKEGDLKLKKSDEPSALEEALDIFGLIEKGGEGSKGGKVIGHTKSGKPIYDSGIHSDFTNEDHMDAAKIHADKAIEHKSATFKNALLSKHNAAKTEHHESVSKLHHAASEKAAALKAWQEHHDKVKTPEEKEVAKKWIEHYSKD